MKKVKAVFRLFLLALLSIFVMISQTIILAVYRGPASYLIPILWERGARRLFGVRLIVDGAPVRDRHVLYISNHMSYIDIPVMGSLVYASFVARGDAEKWPIWGYLGKMQQTIYISRKREDAVRGKNTLDHMLKDHKNLIIFAEGTSSDGSQVLPFKSSLFSLALDNPTGEKLLVQPVTLALLDVDGKIATTREIRDLYAWHREMDMELTPHIWRFAQLKGATVHVRFHPPRDAAQYTDRKSLCNDCYNDVSQGLAALLTPLAPPV